MITKDIDTRNCEEGALLHLLVDESYKTDQKTKHSAHGLNVNSTYPGNRVQIAHLDSPNILIVYFLALAALTALSSKGSPYTATIISHIVHPLALATARSTQEKDCGESRLTSPKLFYQ